MALVRSSETCVYPLASFSTSNPKAVSRRRFPFRFSIANRAYYCSASESAMEAAAGKLIRMPLGSAARHSLARPAERKRTPRP